MVDLRMQSLCLPTERQGTETVHRYSYNVSLTHPLRYTLKRCDIDARRH